MVLIPALNQPFKVSFEKFPETFDAKIIHVRQGSDPFRKYTVEIWNKKNMYDNIDPIPRLSEVDTDWFDEELTGRKINLN